MSPPVHPAVPAPGRLLSAVLLLLAVLVLLFSSAVSLHTADRLADSIASVSHTQRVLEQINRLWGVLGDRDSQLLRYLLIGREQNLESFRQALREMERATGELDRLMADSPDQRRRLSELGRLHGDRIRRAMVLIDLKQRAARGDAAAADALERELENFRGASNADAMRDVLDCMAEREKALLAERSRERAQMIQRNRATVLGANGLALAAGAAAYLAIRRWRRREDEAQRARIEAEEARRSSREQARLLAEIERARDRLQWLARERQFGLERVAHDLRGHFGNVLFSTHLLAEGPGAEAQARLVSTIRASAQGGLLFLQAVLEQARDGLDERALEPLAPAPLVQAAMAAHAGHAAAKGMRVQARLDEALRLRGHAVAFVHVLDNLLSNALKYAPAGSVIELELEAGPDRGLLRVLDHGPGIPAAEQSSLFRRFAPLSPQATGGEPVTGLGLSLARQHARSQGGELRYEDRSGGGACFVLEWPLA